MPSILLRIRIPYPQIHFSTVTWTLQKSTTGIDISSLDDQIALSVYPNPAKDLLNIEVNAEHQGKMSLGISALDGNQTIPIGQNFGANRATQIDITNLAPGAYILTLKINELVFRKLFTKE